MRTGSSSEQSATYSEQRKDGRGQNPISQANLKPFEKGTSGNPSGRPSKYENLKKVLKKLNREEWLQGEFKPLEDPGNFKAPNLEKLYMRIKNIRTLAPQNFAIICELALWREQAAQTRDCLAKSIVRDESLLELARKAPIDIEGLGRIRGLHKNEITRSKQKILAAIQRGLNLPQDKIPRLPELKIYKAPPGIEEMLSAFVQIRAEQLKIEPSVLADRKKINDFI